MNVASIYFQIDSFHNFVSWQEFENGAPTPGGSGDVHHAQLVQLVKRQRSKLDEQQQRLGQLEQELIVSEANLANIQQRDHDQSLQLARQLAHLQEVSHQHDQEVTPSIHPFIRPSVRPSVRPSIFLSASHIRNWIVSISLLLFIFFLLLLLSFFIVLFFLLIYFGPFFQAYIYFFFQ